MDKKPLLAGICVVLGASLAAAQSAPAKEKKATAMGSLAASMKPGEWAELKTADLVECIKEPNGGATGSIFPYSEDAAWDPNTRQLLFIGSDHIYDGKSSGARFVAYSADANAWKILPNPPWFHRGTRHGYDHGAINPTAGIYYHFKFSDGNRTICKYDTKAGTWSEAPFTFKAYYAGVEYFPEMGGVVVVENGNVFFFNEGAGKCTSLAGGLAMGDYHNFAEYNPVHKAMILGGGNASPAVYKLDAAGKITPLSKAPFQLRVNQSIVTVDPVGGDFLVFGGEGGGSFYVYDVVSDRWTPQNGSIPLFSHGSGTSSNSKVDLTIAAPVSTFGVAVFVMHRGNQAWVYLYKHSAKKR